MQFTTIVLAVSTLATGLNAAVLRRDGERLAQFRIFGDAACGNLNYGFYTIDESDANKCQTIDNSPAPISSVKLEAVKPAGAACTLTVYTDAACSAGAQVAAKDTCVSSSALTASFNSWKLSC